MSFSGMSRRGSPDSVSGATRLSAHALEPPVYVRQYDGQLHRLDSWLGTIALVGKVASRSDASQVLSNVASTQERFRVLRAQLASALTEEHAHEYEMTLGSLAKVAVDMLVRNLFERSADVGFLSTDSVIRAFMADADETTAADVVHRLERYVAKYSVYDNILLLDPEGALRSCLKHPGGEPGCDELLMAAVSRQDIDYFELCRPSPLLPCRRQSHLFVAPIRQDDSATARRIGYLCLSFDLADEMRRIFAEVGDGEHELALLDAAGRVVSSSLPLLAPGMSLKNIGADRVEVLPLQGQRYVCRQVTGSAYQGYAGLGWRCMTLTLLRQRTHATSGRTDAIGAGEAEDDSAVSPSQKRLNDIRLEASIIAQQLNLAVINGHIMSARNGAAELTPVLRQIREIGDQTQQLFEGSISTLRQGMSHIVNADATMRAFSMINIMDRNLYERANDVRWWALDERIRSLMAMACRGDGGARSRLTEVIGAINRLYTVYTNILLFDLQGGIVAVSDTAFDGLIGTRMPEALPLAECLRIRSDQDYVVSEFLPSALYGDQPTYFYMTSVIDRASGQPVGGIATVFDATREFRQILSDNLPGQASPTSRPFALIVEAGGKVISSTLSEISPHALFGDALPQVLALRDGQRRSQRVRHDGHDYLAAMVASSGYREYKREDNYRNDMIAIACLPVG